MKDIAPPPLPIRDQVSLRLLARAIDFFFWLWLIALLLWGFMHERAFQREWPIEATFWSFVVLGSTMLLDAVVHALFHTTPGRFWTGGAVRTGEGHPLSLGQHLRRNGAIWFGTLACFVFPFYLFTFTRFYRRLLKGKAAPHDERLGYQVTVREGGAITLAALVLIAQSLVTIAGLAALFLNRAPVP